MFEASKIEHSHTTIGAAAHEDVNAVSTETHVKDFLIMGNQLCFGSQRWYVPYSTCRVNTRSNYETWGEIIPVQ